MATNPDPRFHFLTVVGARPQFVKAATVSRAANEREDVRETLVHTGQHFDDNMSEVFFRELGIPRPDHALDIHGGGHGEMTGRMLIALEAVMQAERPDAVLVFGDTNSTLAAALCATKLRIPLAHVEAGVRSFDRTMPEEINRVVVDAVSDLMFAPTATAVHNLKVEGVRGAVLAVGDVNYDATLMMTELALKQSDITARLGLSPGGFNLATVHRAAAADDPEALGKIFAWLRDQARAMPLVIPMHPRTGAALQRFGLSTEGLTVVDPVGPLDMHRLLYDCAQVFTDSGGLQKEAYFHRKPCVTLRDTTEWVETVDAGWNRLWRGPEFAPRRPIEDYGSGDAARAIVAALVTHFGNGAQP